MTRKMIELKDIKALIIIFVFATCVISINAQSVSPYSRYGLGTFEQKGSIRSHIMGGAAIALQDKYDVNNLNPSALVAADTTSVIVDLGIHVNGSAFTDDDEYEWAFSGNLDYFTLMIPIRSWWFFSGTLQPLTSVGYSITSYSNYSAGSSSLYYSTNYSGDGGINLVSATNSFKLPLGFSIGAEVGFLWGNHEETITEYYAGMDMSTSIRTDISYHTGFWLSTGMQYTHTFNKLSLVVGAIYEIPTNILSKNESSIITSWETIEDKTGATKNNNMPEGYGAGLSLSYNKKWTLSGDYRIKKWSETEFGVDPGRLCDNTIYSLGGEFIPNYNSNKYMNRIAYRLGVHYESGSFEVKSEPVESAYVSLGVGLPGRLRSKLNVGLELGTIGGFNRKHMNETYGQVNIGITLGETWFVKTKFE